VAPGPVRVAGVSRLGPGGLAPPPAVPACGYALGAQAGETAIHQVVTDAGFTRFWRVAETPFNQGAPTARTDNRVRAVGGCV
jgi:hypothetical protein